ncbi:conserved hypothetical protein [Ricinus communis]|uniref:Uncharacterized protein n=1 Tax=Ricinus communis TaxID=3988 RepID=B9SYG2_RICCO|nr:conserved hypothetical protein [Ricinus communis]
MSAGIFTAPVAGSGYHGLKANSTKQVFPAKDSSVAWSRKTVSNGSKTYCMKTWNPINNTKLRLCPTSHHFLMIPLLARLTT